MSSQKPFFIKSTLFLCAISLTGCATWFIDNRQGSEKIALKEAIEVTNCQLIGTTTVSVLSKVGFVTRGVDNIEINLLQLAKNSAVDMGGDTVVKKETSIVGQRPFDIFKCN